MAGAGLLWHWLDYYGKGLDYYGRGWIMHDKGDEIYISVHRFKTNSTLASPLPPSGEVAVQPSHTGPLNLFLICFYKS